MGIVFAKLLQLLPRTVISGVDKEWRLTAALRDKVSESEDLAFYHEVDKVFLVLFHLYLPASILRGLS